MRNLLTLLCLTAFLAFPSLAQAQLPFDVGVSVKGGPNGSGIGKPGEESYKGVFTPVPYPGFFGVGGGVGFFVEPRIYDIIGIEFGIQYAFTQGEGDIDFPFGETTVNVEETELLIPIHLRFALPAGELVHIMFSVGTDILIPLDVKVNQTGGVRIPGLEASEREGGAMLGFGFGVEIGTGVGVYIPIEFKGRWNPYLGDTFDDRLDFDLSGNTVVRYGVKPNWAWQGEVMIGVGYRLDILQAAAAE